MKKKKHTSTINRAKVKKKLKSKPNQKLQTTQTMSIIEIYKQLDKWMSDNCEWREEHTPLISYILKIHNEGISGQIRMKAFRNRLKGGYIGKLLCDRRFIGLMDLIVLMPRNEGGLETLVMELKSDRQTGTFEYLMSRSYGLYAIFLIHIASRMQLKEGEPLKYEEISNAAKRGDLIDIILDSLLRCSEITKLNQGNLVEPGWLKAQRQRLKKESCAQAVTEQQ